MRYFALLRGINVGGNKKVVMKDLKELFEKKGLLNVSTLLNTGNVVFETDQAIQKIDAEIEALLDENYDFHIPSIVYEERELMQFLENESVKKLIESVKKGDKVIFTFARDLNQEEINQLKRAEEFEVIHAGEAIICLHFSVERVGTPTVMKVLDNALNSRGTSRNLNTINKIIKKLEAI